MTPEEGRNWQALHEHMQKVLEDQLLSLGWQYGPGEGLLAGIQWMGDRIRELEADRIKWMSISYSVEEWIGGRITDDDLKAHATKVLDELAAENNLSNER